MNNDPALPEPGLIVMFGSGETSPTGRKVFEQVFHSLPPSPRVALLETPAGFELNSPQVIGRVGFFLTRRLQNFTPRVETIPARKRGTQFSPDNPEIVDPLLQADLIFMGPGSPSYAIRQLHDSLAWYYLVARHHLGSVLVLASAATVAFSAYALPVYEIYKVGEDIRWLQGLDFFRLYGLRLVFIPHWNNQEGGAELDTSRCFMGRERFASLLEMLPKGVTVIGLDEKTALIIDPSNKQCRVKGIGRVTIIHVSKEQKRTGFSPSSSDQQDHIADSYEDLASVAELRTGHLDYYHNGQVFSMNELGQFHSYHPQDSLPEGVWQKAVQAARCMGDKKTPITPDEVTRLIEERESARRMGDWRRADELRRQVTHMGWEIMDTKKGPVSKQQKKAQR